MATVPKGFRATIPKEARELLGLDVGDQIVFFTVEEKPGWFCFRKLSQIDLRNNERGENDT
jgi:AbrB family looped-hinge helix DNA binding protein